MGRARVSLRWVIAAASLCLVLGSLGYLRVWLKEPISSDAQAAEAALADGSLVAIAHVNVEKLAELDQYAFGDLDPGAFPISDQEKDLLAELFTGPSNFREQLEQVFCAVNASAADARVRTTLLLSGDFETEEVLRAVRRDYQLEPRPSDHWLAVEAKPQRAEPPCPKDGPGEGGTTPFYLQVSTERILLVSDLEHGAHVLRRLAQSAAAAQDIGPWLDYRTGKLASAMVLSTNDTAKALGGLAGMVAQQAAAQSTQVTGLAAAVGVDLLKRGLRANLRVSTNDRDWSRKTANEVRHRIDAIKDDTRTVSPTLAGLLSGITVDGEPEFIELDVALGAAVLNDFGQVVNEVVGTMFSADVTESTPGDKPPPDRIQSHPKDYEANAALMHLPNLQLELKSYQSPPLFQSGPIAVDLETIRMNEDGFLELKLNATAALPKGETQFGQERTAHLSLRVNSVSDADGHELMRDERCLDDDDMPGRSRNHEPVTTGSTFRDRADIWKAIRLREDAMVEDIHRVRGRVSVSAPVVVRKFAVPLRAGESISHEGVRFYLSRIRDRSVSYQVSGFRERLLEVRALNVEGKPLQPGGKWTFGVGGRTTQEYEGQIRALEIFVSEETVEHDLGFQLSEPFSEPPESGGTRPSYLAPENIDPEAWAPYETLDMSQLGIDPRVWQMFDKTKKPIASVHWPGVSMFVTHTPERWGNSPIAYVYYPMLKGLPGVLSAISCQLDHLAANSGAVPRYYQAAYPYRSADGEVVVQHWHEGHALAQGSWPLNTGLKGNERLTRLKGKLVFRLPTETSSAAIEMHDLWRGKTVDGVTVTLTDVGRGMFPGYSLKVEGELSRLVNLHGISTTGERVVASPINFQPGGYWTMTLPFGRDIKQVDLITAQQQKVIEHSFDLQPSYPADH